MDSWGPARTLKQGIAKARRLGRSWIALQRLDLQWRLKLGQLARGLSNAPVLAVLARLGPAPTLWPPAFWRHWRFSRHTGGTWPLVAWLVPAWKCSWRWDAHAGDGYDGIAGARTWYTGLCRLPAYAPIAVEWPCGSAYAEGCGDKG
jgi:hypothetical protein